MRFPLEKISAMVRSAPGLLGLLISALLMFVAVLSVPILAPANPVIIWTPGSLTESVLPGESKTISVSVTPSENADNIVARVVPELQAFVHVDPSSFTTITAGLPISVSITVSAPSDSSVEKLSGTIQLRSAASPGKTFAKPLPIVLHIGRVFASVENGYEVTYDPSMVVTTLESTRPGFIAGELFRIPGDMPNLSVSVYENPALLPVEEWFVTTLADREYSLPDGGNRTTSSVIVAGVAALQVRSTILGYVQLRTFVAHGNKIFGLETTVPDDVNVPEDYFAMLKTFSFTE